MLITITKVEQTWLVSTGNRKSQSQMRVSSGPKLLRVKKMRDLGFLNLHFGKFRKEETTLVFLQTIGGTWLKESGPAHMQ